MYRGHDSRVGDTMSHCLILNCSTCIHTEGERERHTQRERETHTEGERETHKSMCEPVDCAFYLFKGCIIVTRVPVAYLRALSLLRLYLFLI
jgi:hypothetical protein